jgi:hypothetical protein
MGIRPTHVTVSCAPAMIAGRATTCTATVTDEEATPITPTGMVAFSSSDSKGTFSPPDPCELKATGEEGKASCSVQYTPAHAGSVKITAVYAGDGTHAESEGAQEGPVSSRATHLAVGCGSGLLAGNATTCTATVADEEEGVRSAPAGTVTFSSSDPQGTFGPPNTCKLKPTAEEGKSACAVQYTPAKHGSTDITAKYGGDEAHAESTGSQKGLIVGARTTQVTVSCGSGVVLGQTASCSARVTDTSLEGTPSMPKGMVTFGADLYGRLSPEC